VRLKRLWTRAAVGAANRRGSITRRMIGISAVWILILLGVGGFALDRVLTSAITRNFDAQLEYVLTAMIASSEIDPDGQVQFNRPPADQRFLEPYSGLYYQVSGEGFESFQSRSHCDRRLDVGAPHRDTEIHDYHSDEFTKELLRVDEDHEARAWQIILDFTDQTFSYTDATTFAVAESIGIDGALSLDRHFRRYGQLQVMPSV
jgi:hypothetical protein